MTCQFGQRTGSYSSYWGYSAQQCQTWMNGELTRLSQEVTDMQNAGNLTGRKKAAALAKGIKAQESLTKCCSNIRLFSCQIDTRVNILVPFCIFVHSGATSTFPILNELDQVLLKHQTLQLSN